MRHILTLSILMIILTTFGCSLLGPKSLRDLPEELRQSSIISISNSKIDVPSSGSFAFMIEASRFYDDPRIDGARLNAMLQSAIEKEMIRKGYRLGMRGNCDLMVGYVVALESTLDDNAISSSYGFNTGWSVDEINPKKYEKGTLIVDIFDARTKKPIWRGAMQAYVGFDLSEKIRRKRINMAISMLLARFSP